MLVRVVDAIVPLPGVRAVGLAVLLGTAVEALAVRRLERAVLELALAAGFAPDAALEEPARLPPLAPIF